MLSSTSIRLPTVAVALGRRHMQTATASAAARWSQTLSFASAESDFCCSASSQQSQQERRHQSTIAAAADDDNTFLSFASPESDFTAQNVLQPLPPKRSLFAEPARQPSQLWSEALLFTSPESDFCGNLPPVEKSMAAVLPRTFGEAMLMEDEAVVITTAEAPHKIVHVNEAWEDLCGFTKQEVLHKSFDIIQGPESNTTVAERMVEKLSETLQPQDAYLVNYTKEGKKFINHLSVGPLSVDDNTQFFVGILEKVEPDQVPLRMVA